MSTYLAFVPPREDPGGCTVVIDGIVREFAIPDVHKKLRPDVCPEIVRSGQADVALVILAHHCGELDDRLRGAGDLFYLRRGYGITGYAIHSHRLWKPFVDAFLAENAWTTIKITTLHIAAWLYKHLQAQEKNHA